MNKSMAQVLPPQKSRPQAQVRPPQKSTSQPQAHQQRMSLQVIADKLEKLRFKTALFGYSKKDVWHKISRLDEMYRELYELQEYKYQALLRERDELVRRSSALDPSQTRGRP